MREPIEGGLGLIIVAISCRKGYLFSYLIKAGRIIEGGKVSYMKKAVDKVIPSAYMSASKQL